MKWIFDYVLLGILIVLVVKAMLFSKSGISTDGVTNTVVKVIILYFFVRLAVHRKREL